MKQDKAFARYLLFICLFAAFLPGCVYISHLDETMFMKSLGDSQQEMQAELDKEGELYSKLKADIDNGALKKLTKRKSILYRYGEPTSCKPCKGSGDIKETCVYRNPAGGMLTEMILLNFDAQNKLYSWQVENPAK